MCRRFGLALALVVSVVDLVVFSSGLRAYASNAQSNSEGPPWGIADVTNEELTPERFEGALPSTFGDYGLELEGGENLGEHPLYSFSTKSYTYSYFDGTPGSLTVDIADIGSELTVAKAIETISLQYRTNPYVERFEFEGGDTSATANVPFVRMTVVDAYDASYVLAWGSKDGK